MSTSRFGTLAIAALMATGCSKDPQVAKREFVASGDKFYSAGKYQEAAVQYRNAVQQDAQFGEARLKLADTAEHLGDGNTALKEYVRAADLMPNDLKAQLKAGELSLVAGQFDDARARALKALALAPNSAEAHVLRANSLAGLKDLDAAIAQLEQAIKDEPTRSLTYANLGTLQYAKGNIKEAESALNRAVEIDPKSATSRLALANFYWSTGRPSLAENALKEVLAIDPNNLLANHALALLYVGTGRTAQAEAPLKMLAANGPSSEGAKLMLADYYASTNRPDDALKLYDQLAKSQGLPGVASARKSAVLYATGKKSEAYAAVDEVLKKDPTNGAALIQKSDLLRQDKKLDEALGLAQQAAANPRFIAAQLQVGRLQAARRDWDSSIAAYNSALTLSPKLVPALLELSSVQIAAGRPADALHSAEGALTVQPNSAQAMLLKARALLASGNSQGAQEPMALLASNFPNLSAVQAQLGTLYALRHDSAAARTAYGRALKADPENMDADLGLVALDAREKNTAAAHARLDAAVSRHSDSPDFLFAAASWYATLGDSAAVDRTLKHVIEIQPASLEAYLRLGQLYANERHVDAALAQFDELGRRNPRSIAAQTMAGMLLEMSNRRADARKRYEQALAIDSHAAIAANNLAVIYVDTGENLDRALQLAQEAKAQLPDQAEINDTLGWIYCKKNFGNLAIPPLLISVAKDPNNSVYLGHLGIAYAKSGDRTKARETLKKAFAHSKDFPDSSEARTTLASLGERESF